MIKMAQGSNKCEEVRINRVQKTSFLQNFKNSLVYMIYTLWLWVILDLKGLDCLHLIINLDGMLF